MNAEEFHHQGVKHITNTLATAMNYLASELNDRMAKTTDPAVQRTLNEARPFVRDKRNDLLDSFCSRLGKPKTEMTQQERIQALAAMAAPKAPGLNIMKDDDSIESALINAQADALLKASAPELRLLKRQLATLNAPGVDLEFVDPDSIATALMRALKEQGASLAVRKLLFPIFNSLLPNLLKDSYKGLLAKLDALASGTSVAPDPRAKLMEGAWLRLLPLVKARDIPRQGVEFLKNYADVAQSLNQADDQQGPHSELLVLLIDSLDAENWAKARATIVRSLPTLLKLLNNKLEASAIDAVRREAFTTGLAELHMAMMKTTDA